MDSLVGFPSALLAAAEAHGESGSEGHGTGLWIFLISGLVFAIILAYAAACRRGINNKGVFTNFWALTGEHLILFLRRIAGDLMGPSGFKYVPILAAFWLYIFVSNVLALVLPTSPSADMSLNLALALVTILYVQYEGIRANGFVGYLKHFAGPSLGKPTIGKTFLSILIYVMLSLAIIAVSLLIFAVEVTSELIKNFSLTVRLYGNIEGGHIVKDALDSIASVPSLSGKPAPLPLGGILFPIKFFTCLIQAYIWVMLFGVYLSLMTSHGDDHGDDHGPDPVEHGELPVGALAH